jgi:predicted PurR-regulated permease PerM
MTTPPPPSTSPSWGPMTKLVVGLTIVAIIAGLLVQFRSFIGPLILVFILTYLINPIAVRLSKTAHLSWRAAVNLIYLFLIIILVALFTLTGLAVAQQLQSLVGLVQRFVTGLPDLATNLSTQVLRFGPFEFSFKQFDLPSLTNQVLATVQPLLGRVGGLVSSFASSAAVTLGWGIFVMLVSYFLLADASQVSDDVIGLDIPGYNTDIRRLGNELREIWNAFLRGQLIIILLILVCYTLLMLLLGMKYAIGIAIMAGLARFIPYVGPLATWTVAALVAFFQPVNYFGLQPLHYAILVVGCALLLDQIFDNLIGPRIMGHTLGVHPAAVLVAALVLTRLIGIVGLVLAAPVLATLELLGRYVVRKMFDLDPWPEPEKRQEPRELPWKRGVLRLRAWWRRMQQRSQ